MDGKEFSVFERENALPRTTIRRILDGDDPRASTLAALAKAVNKRVSYFFGDDDAEEPARAGGAPPPASAGGGRVPTRQEVIATAVSIQGNLSRLLIGVVEDAKNEHPLGAAAWAELQAIAARTAEIPIEAPQRGKRRHKQEDSGDRSIA